jgi:hypothetical protein
LFAIVTGLPVCPFAQPAEALERAILISPFLKFMLSL